MSAVIATGPGKVNNIGHQSDVLRVEKLEGEAGGNRRIRRMLLVGEG